MSNVACFGLWASAPVATMRARSSAKELRRLEASFRIRLSTFRKLRAIRLSSNSLHANILGREHVVLQCVHAACRLIHLASERDRAFQYRLEPLLILNPRRRILVLDYKMGVRHIQIEQLARSQLMVQPVNGAVL